MKDLNISSDLTQELIGDITSGLRSLEYDIALRNRYMNERDRYLYGDGLWETLDIPDGFDKTKYNYLKPTVEIHTSQFMGRGFNVYSDFDKEDIEIIQENDQIPVEQKATETQIAVIRNKKRKADADQRKKIWEAIVADNGGLGIFKHGGKIGSSYGETVFKMWPDFDQKKVRISLIETPQNWRPFWADSNFRERDADGYVYQISKSWASRLYGDDLPAGAVFESSMSGSPFGSRTGTNGDTSDPLDQKNKSNIPLQTEQEMVNVIDFTGYREGWGISKSGKLVKVKSGQEKPFSALIVGGWLVELIVDEKKLPKYYRMPNKLIPQRAFGESDIDDSLMQINATIMERMSDWLTIANKTLFPMIQAKGFETANLPTKTSRQMKVVPMDQDQSLEAVNLPNNFGFDYKQIITALEDAYVRVSRIGRVLFEDNSINTNSNQALMTTLKGVIDVVESKQAIWEPELVKMATDGLQMAALISPSLKNLVSTEDNWQFRIEWPSVLRREDQVYRTMWLNEFNAGTISLDTYQEKIGIDNPTEEIDRIRDNMKDKVTAAVLGKQLPILAEQIINPPAQPTPDVKYNVQVKTDATPEAPQILDQIGIAPTPGPRPEASGSASATATPQVAQGDNVTQPMSQPGSGAPAVSPAGAGATTRQNQGA